MGLSSDRADRQGWTALVLACLSQVCLAFTYGAAAPLAPLLKEDMGLTAAQIGMFLSATHVIPSAVMLFVGSIIDRFGIRWTMALGQVFAGLMTGCLALTGSFVQMLALLTAAGLGTSTIPPGSTKAIMDWFPARTRGTAMGLKQTGFPIGGILIAFTLPTEALALGWRAAFAVSGLIIVITGVLTGAFYRDVKQQVQTAAQRPAVWSGLGEVVRTRRLWTVSVFSLIFGTVQMTVITYLALYFDNVVLIEQIPDERVRVVAAGGYLAACQTGGIVGRVVWGAVSDRIFNGRRLVVVAIIGVLAALSLAAAGFLNSGHPAWLLTLIAFTVGTATVGWAGLYQTILVETAGRKHTAAGVGFGLALSQIGIVAGPPLLGFLADVTGSYQAMWLLMSLMCSAGAIMAIAWARRETSPE